MMKILSIFWLGLFMMTSCEENNIKQDLNSQWQLDGVFLSDAYDSPCGWEAGELENPVTLNISDGKISGNGPVNAYFASATFANGKVKVENIGSTKKAGPEPLMNCETRYFNFLTNASQYLITVEGELHIGNFRTADSPARDGGTYLVFKEIATK